LTSLRPNVNGSDCKALSANLAGIVLRKENFMNRLNPLRGEKHALVKVGATPEFDAAALINLTTYRTGGFPE
jgi:hypothetical protein